MGQKVELLLALSNRLLDTCNKRHHPVQFFPSARTLVTRFVHLDEYFSAYVQRGMHCYVTINVRYSPAALKRRQPVPFRPFYNKCNNFSAQPGNVKAWTGATDLMPGLSTAHKQHTYHTYNLRIARVSRYVCQTDMSDIVLLRILLINLRQSVLEVCVASETMSHRLSQI